MKENEPLKGKRKDLLHREIVNVELGRLFLVSDVQSAVQGLLQEIDKAIKYYTVQNAINESTFRDERIEGLKIARNLIKKWFPDVFERGGENEAKED